MVSVSSVLVKTDRICDYIPAVSSITNLVDLFQKCAILPCMDSETIASNNYFKHVDEKSFGRCLLLIILGIGNIIIIIYDLCTKGKDDTVIEVSNGKEKEVKEKESSKVKVTAKKQATSRPQDASLEEISKMTQESMQTLCKNLEVNNRRDYIKGMLIFAIQAEKFADGNADMLLHEMIQHFERDGELEEFVHEDIKAGRNNQDDTLLHELLACTFISPKTKGSAFSFILRDGHDYLRDYYGNRRLGEKNKWGNQPKYFDAVKWGDSLKKVFGALTATQQKEFFAEMDKTCSSRLKEFTGISEAAD